LPGGKQRRKTGEEEEEEEEGTARRSKIENYDMDRSPPSNRGRSLGGEKGNIFVTYFSEPYL
jgi:hypothetical protein